MKLEKEDIQNIIVGVVLFLFGIPGLPISIILTPYLVFAKETEDTGFSYYKYHGGGSGMLGLGMICYFMCGLAGWLVLLVRFLAL